MTTLNKFRFVPAFSAFAALFALTAQSASATTFDFVAYAVNNEHGATSETFTNEGLSVTASGRDLANSVNYFMYLDDLSGGNPGGLGVCKNGGADCNPSEEDSLGPNEVLQLVFDAPVLISSITFSNGGHLDAYSGNFGVATDATPTSSGSFTQYLSAADFNTALLGTRFSFISNATFSGNAGDTNQLYISSITASRQQVPEPATMSLLALGLAGAGFRSKRKKESLAA